MSLRTHAYSLLQYHFFIPFRLPILLMHRMQPNFVVQARNFLTITIPPVPTLHCECLSIFNTIPTIASSCYTSLLPYVVYQEKLRLRLHRSQFATTRRSAVLEMSFDILLDAGDVEHGRNGLWRDFVFL